MPSVSPATGVSAQQGPPFPVVPGGGQLSVSEDDVTGTAMLSSGASNWTPVSATSLITP